MTQDIFAITIVAIAAGFLVRRAWHNLARSRAGTCGGCSNCSASKPFGAPTLVALSMDLSHAKAQSRKEVRA
jgi:hypothetical protein